MFLQSLKRNLHTGLAKRLEGPAVDDVELGQIPDHEPGDPPSVIPKAHPSVGAPQVVHGAPRDGLEAERAVETFGFDRGIQANHPRYPGAQVGDGPGGERSIQPNLAVIVVDREVAEYPDVPGRHGADHPEQRAPGTPSATAQRASFIPRKRSNAPGSPDSSRPSRTPGCARGPPRPSAGCGPRVWPPEQGAPRAVIFWVPPLLSSFQTPL